MIATALAFIVVAQQAGDTVLAIYPEDPTTWTLDYPVRIEPYVSEYYNCLRGGSYAIGNDVSFGSQYEKDIPRCAKKAQSLEAEANSVLAASGGADATPPSEVAYIFDRARRIHIARGKSLDLSVRTRLANSSGYSLDGSCAAGVQTLIDQRASYMQAEELRIEALVGKSDQTPEEQAALARYRDQLNRYNELITLERSECAAANEREAQQKSLESAQQTNAQD